MNIPEEVIEAAAKAQYEWQDGLPSWENDADGFTKAEYLSQTVAAAHVIAEWARKEALLEAAEVARSTPLTLDDIGYEAQVIAEAILELAEGAPDEQQ